MDERFIERTIDFPVRLGEWTLCAPRRRLLVLRRGIFDAPMSHTDGPSGSGLGIDHDGYMIASPVGEGGRQGAVGFRNGMVYRIVDVSPRYYVLRDGTFQEYLARFNGKHRSTLRRKVRKLERESGEKLDVRAYTGKGFDDFFQGARQVSTETYQEIMFDAGLPTSHESVTGMRADFLEGRAKGYLLFVNDRPIAYLCMPIRDNVMEYQYLGFRPAYAEFSPGTVLLFSVLELMFNEKAARALDFGEGGSEGSYKATFANDSVPYQVTFWLTLTPANIALIMAQKAADTASSLVGMILQRMGVKRRVRLLMRRLKGVEHAGLPG